MRAPLLATLTLAILASCADTGTATVAQAEYNQFGWIVTRILGPFTGGTLLNYGCHCGRGNDDYTIWVDEVDNCCRVHDEAYLAAPAVAEGCNCGSEVYKYSIARGVVTCDDKQGACAKHCCKADKAFVECVGPIASTMQNKYASMDRANVCTPRECLVDEDCEAGTWCGGGTCRPYCDPGYPGLAATGCQPVPDPEPLPDPEPTPVPDPGPEVGSD